MAKLETQHFSSVIYNKKRLHFDKESLKKDEITFEELDIKKGQRSWGDEFGTLTNIKEAKVFDDKMLVSNIPYKYYNYKH